MKLKEYFMILKRLSKINLLADESPTLKASVEIDKVRLQHQM